MDRKGASVRISPTPQQLLTVSVALLPRWRAPASHSHSSWQTALSQIYIYIFFIFTKRQDTRRLSASARAASPPPFVYLLQRHFFSPALLSSLAQWKRIWLPVEIKRLPAQSWKLNDRLETLFWAIINIQIWISYETPVRLLLLKIYEINKYKIKAPEPLKRKFNVSFKIKAER